MQMVQQTTKQSHSTRVQVTTIATQTDSTFNGMQNKQSILYSRLINDSDYLRSQDTTKE